MAKRKDKLLTNSQVDCLIEKTKHILDLEHYKLTPILKELIDLLEQKNSIEDLLKIDKEVCGKILRQLVLEETIEGKQNLLKLFKNIADINFKCAQLSNDLKYYTDSAIVCCYIISIINKHFSFTDIEEIRSLEEYSYSLLDNINHELIRACSSIVNNQSNTSVVKIINNDSLEKISKKNLLKDLRKYTSYKLKKLDEYRLKKDETKYVECGEKLFNYIANGMKKYLENLCKEAEELLGPSPCEYLIIGLGSMALKQITPYSDLEFAILTENEDYKNDHELKVREYFKNFSHLVHFKVICLGETPISEGKYKVNMDYLISTAVQFDLGGKTPLGRIARDKEYELIQTVEEMMNYVKNDSDRKDVDKTLPNILEKICLIHGNEELGYKYRKQLQQFMSSSSDQNKILINSELRAISILNQEIVEIDYTQNLNSEKRIKRFKSNLEEFEPYLDSYGRLFDVKQEIYRIPDRLIYNLSKIYELQENSAWETLNSLERKGILNKKAADNLKYALTFATTLRVKTYDHYKCQKEKMSFIPLDKDLGIKKLSETFGLAEQDCAVDGNLFRFYYTMIPFHKKLFDYCQSRIKNELKNEEKENYFNKEEFFENSATIKAHICIRLLKLKEALDICFKEKEELGKQYTDNEKIADNLYITGSVYYYLTDYSQARKYSLEALKIREEIYGEDHLKVAASLESVSNMYQEFGEYDNALNYQLRALEIKKRVLGETHRSVAISQNNISVIYQQLTKYDEALDHILRSKETNKMTLGKMHPEFVTNLINISSIYKDRGEYNKAFKYQLRALKISKEIFGENHSEVATCLNKLGIICQYFDKYGEALKCQQYALKINEKIFDPKHLTIAINLNSMGITYSYLGNYKAALQCQRKALEFAEGAFKGKHSKVATSIDNIGSIYRNFGAICQEYGQYELALDCYSVALKHHLSASRIYKEMIEKNPLKIAVNSDNIGSVYQHISAIFQKCGKRELASDFCRMALKPQLKALDIYLKVWGNRHPKVAMCSNNIGITCQYLEDYDNALKYQLPALHISKEKFGSEHSYVAICSNNIGLTYMYREEFGKALKSLLGSLEINTKLYNEPHLEVASNLNSISIALKNMKLYNEAIYYECRRLDIVKKVTGEHSLEAAYVKNSIADLHLREGNFDNTLAYAVGALVIYIKNNYRIEEIKINKFILFVKDIKSNFEKAVEELNTNERATESFTNCLKSTKPLKVVLEFFKKYQYDTYTFKAINQLESIYKNLIDYKRLRKKDAIKLVNILKDKKIISDKIEKKKEAKQILIESLLAQQNTVVSEKSKQTKLKQRSSEAEKLFIELADTLESMIAAPQEVENANQDGINITYIGSLVENAEAYNYL